MADAARAGHAIGMADRDRATVDVRLVERQAEPVHAVEHLAGEGLVQLPEVDVLDLEPMPLQQARHREHRPDAHLVGLAAGHGKALENAERLQPALRRLFALHHDASRRAVRELARIAGGDEFVEALHRLQRGQAFIGRVRPIAFVAIDRIRNMFGLAVSLLTTVITVSIGTISSLNLPACCAAAVRFWLSRL